MESGGALLRGKSPAYGLRSLYHQHEMRNERNLREEEALVYYHFVKKEPKGVTQNVILIC